MKNESLKHSQLPNEMGLEGLKPKDQLVYVCLRSYMNNKTMEAFPSLQLIAASIGTSINTVRASIDRLVEKNYISKRKDGKKNVYKFNELVKFEPFSDDFIKNPNISFTTKSYLTASQQYMFTDIEGIGKVSMSNRELAKKINMPESTIRNCNMELKRKDFLNVVLDECKDIESGCKGEIKFFQLNKLGQAVIWTLRDHEERLSQTEANINNLAERISILEEKELEKDRLIKEKDEEIKKLENDKVKLTNALLRETDKNKQKNDFKMT